MRKLMLQMLVTFGIGLAGAASGLAQSTQSYRAHIPFDFTVNSVSMKAGDYRIGPLTSTTDQRAMLLQNIDDSKSKVLGFVSVGADRWDKSGGKITFLRSGDDYALANIDTPTFALKLKEIRTNIRVVTQLRKEPETVTVALR